MLSVFAPWIKPDRCDGGGGSSSSKVTAIAACDWVLFVNITAAAPTLMSHFYAVQSGTCLFVQDLSGQPPVARCDYNMTPSESSAVKLLLRYLPPSTKHS